MTRLALGGLLPAFPTPTKADGSVDEPALRSLIRFLLGAGAAGLVPVGGTGEFTALAPPARLRAVRVTVEECAGKVPVVAGVLSPGYAEAVESGRAFVASGADAVLVLAPFYVRPTQDGIRSYFRAYRNDVDVPIVFYDIPGRTGVVTEAETIARMAEEGTIVGMKACNTDMHHFNSVMSAVPESFAALSGEDTLYPFHALMGARGGILATASIMPHHWGDIVGKANAGDFKGALRLQQALLPLFAAVFREGNPGPLKYVLGMLGLPSGDALRPLAPPKAETCALLERAIEDLQQRGIIRNIAANAAVTDLSRIQSAVK